MKKPKKLRSLKAGMPPGSPVHIGEKKTDKPSISVLDFGPGALIETGLPDTASLASYVRQNSVLWGNIYGLQDPAALTAIGAAFHLHPLVLEDILNNNQRQKVDSYNDYLYVVLHRYEISTDPLNLVQDQISLIINTTEGKQAIADSFSIRREALQNRITYSTTVAGAKALVQSLEFRGTGPVWSLQELHEELNA